MTCNSSSEHPEQTCGALRAFLAIVLTAIQEGTELPLVGQPSGYDCIDGGKLENARIVESLTALLIGLNIRYKVRGAGIRFTGLPPCSDTFT
jgi:hypothetical protein